MRLSFGPFAFDRQSRLLWREGTEVALPPRVLGVLEVLLDRAGQVVARQDLLDGVWKDAFVTDTSLAEAVSFLRQALGDDPQAPTYIQTVHRRGYRFLAPVTADGGLTPAAANRGLTPDDATRGRTPDGHFAVASQLRAVSALPLAFIKDLQPVRRASDRTVVHYYTRTAPLTAPGAAPWPVFRTRDDTVFQRICLDIPRDRDEVTHVLDPA